MKYSGKFVGRACGVTHSRLGWMPPALLTVAAVCFLAPPAWSQIACGALGDQPLNFLSSYGFYANFVADNPGTYTNLVAPSERDELTGRPKLHLFRAVLQHCQCQQF
jgi:hypothetical protein